MKKKSSLKLFLLVAYLISISACTGIQIYSSSSHNSISLEKNDLEKFGLAFLTPTTPTGHEEDKQALAFGFSDVLKARRSKINFVSLPTTLGKINRANLTDDYKQMYSEYTITGILKKETLEKFSHLVNVRYFALLNLGQFTTGSNNRFGVLGLRIIDTRYSNIRLFMQIWDSHNGAIAWEGMVELNYSDETISESPVTFKTVVEESAKLMVDKLP